MVEESGPKQAPWETSDGKCQLSTESRGVTLPLPGQGGVSRRGGICASGSATAQPAYPQPLPRAVSLVYPHRVCSSAFRTFTLLMLYILLSFVLQFESKLRTVVIRSCASCTIFFFYRGL